MTHDELVKLAARWLRIRKRHPVVLEDVRCFATSEQPDVIGWTNGGFSTLIEVKVFSSDALRDEKKTFRRDPKRGMGYERIFAFPSGFMKAHPSLVNHLPGGWGIVEFDDKGKAKVIRKGSPFYERNDRAERALLVQAVWKATEGWGRKTFGDLAPEMTDGDPHPTASKVIRDLRIENRKLRDALARERRGGSALRLPNTRIGIEHKLGPGNYPPSAPGPRPTIESLPADLPDARKATWLAINPRARVCLVGSRSSVGTVDGWIGPRMVRVRWDAGHITEIDAECLDVLVAAS